MFGFERRAKERAARDEAALAAVRQHALETLAVELRDTALFLIEKHDLVGRADPLLTKVESVRAGIDSVLIERLDPFGSALAKADDCTRGGGMVANAVRNMLLLTGAFDRRQTRGDLCHILGFSRDGLSERS